MTTSARIRMASSATILGLVLILSLIGSVYAAPGNGDKNKQGQPPALNFTSGQSAQEPKLEGEEAQPMKALGGTKLAKVNDRGQLDASAAKDFSIQAGAVASVDLTNLYNYCYRDRVYVQAKNNTGSVQYVQIRVYSQGYWYEQYTSVPANSYVNVPFYGIQGTYSTYLYTWNGSTYQYDEYKAGENTCRVSITKEEFNTGAGWVRLRIENTGTAYASVRSTELAPYPSAGTYTGTQYNYPAPGGGAQYRWFQVGYVPYGVVSDILGSSVSPSYFYGDL